jgi:hypothetical protein
MPTPVVTPEETWHWWQVAQGVAAITTILMMVAIGPLFKLLHRIRTNDLHHLDLKIDEHHKAMSDKVDAIGKQVQDVDTKLDDHIQWHLNQK